MGNFTFLFVVKSAGPILTAVYSKLLSCYLLGAALSLEKFPCANDCSPYR